MKRLNSNDEKAVDHRVRVVGRGAKSYLANQFWFFLSNIIVSFQFKTYVVSPNITNRTEIEKRTNFQEDFFSKQKIRIIVSWFNDFTPKVQNFPE